MHKDALKTPSLLCLDRTELECVDPVLPLTGGSYTFNSTNPPRRTYEDAFYYTCDIARRFLEGDTYKDLVPATCQWNRTWSVVDVRTYEY